MANKHRGINGKKRPTLKNGKTGGDVEAAPINRKSNKNAITRNYDAEDNTSKRRRLEQLLLESSSDSEEVVENSRRSRTAAGSKSEDGGASQRSTRNKKRLNYKEPEHDDNDDDDDFELDDDDTDESDTDGDDNLSFDFNESSADDRFPRRRSKRIRETAVYTEPKDFHSDIDELLAPGEDHGRMTKATTHKINQTRRTHRRIDDDDGDDVLLRDSDSSPLSEKTTKRAEVSLAPIVSEKLSGFKKRKRIRHRITPKRRISRSRRSSATESTRPGANEIDDNETSTAPSASLFDKEEFTNPNITPTFTPDPEDKELYISARETATLQEKELECTGKVTPGAVQMAGYDIPAWYSSPFPKEYRVLSRLYVCEYCLEYTKTNDTHERHMNKNSSAQEKGCLRHPPGNEIYRENSLSVWEVDGKHQRVFCQNLCLLAKMFMESKTLYYDVEPFLFYVLTEWTTHGAAIVGYFSKEKDSFLKNNLSCILTLPHHQRKGYGRFMIDFSYLLSRKEGKIGSPEKPLSDLGLISYRKYWAETIFGFLSGKRSAISIERISDSTGITEHDIISTLQSLGMIKSWRGQHVIVQNHGLAQKIQASSKNRLHINEKLLKWTPPPPPQAK
eukprot:m.80002 g.80002  ORF g.80002 m.80002 type:complete len:618 (+) comp12735_c1_seq2:637-2490(+)